MLTCKITDTEMIFEWPDEAAVKGTQTYTCSRGSDHTLAQTRKFAQCVINICARLSPNSYNNVFRGLQVIISTLTTNLWPAHNDKNAWQNIIIMMYEKALQRQDQSLGTKITYWSAAERILKELSRIGVIAPSVVIPNTKQNTISGEQATPPLGYKTKKIKTAKSTEDILPKKFMIERDLDEPDDLYLSRFRSELESNLAIVSNALKGYWEEMRATHAIGNSLIESLPIEEREKVISNNGIADSGEHVCSPSNPNALSWFLALAKHQFESGKINAISVQELTRNSFGVSSGRLYDLFRMAKSICPNKYINSKMSGEYVSRLTGLLSLVDCNAATALLVINNPVFTADSLASADLYMENGDCYVQVDMEQGQVRFSVSKPRARARKVAHFNKLSREVLSDIIECTSSLRLILRKKKNRNWRRLFLYMNSRTPANRPNKVSNNNKDKNSLINRLAVDLNAIHTPVDLSLSVLRATVGIITFLRTGSLAVTSMILGNSIEVTESNYVPRWLVRRFGNRTLRILAQKLIVVATHGHPWAQAASDFLHSDDLHRFIVRILNEATGNDPFAVVARKKLGGSSGKTDFKKPVKGELHFHTHPEILAALYSYEKKVATLPVDEQIRIDADTGLSHQAVCSIARLSRLAAELDIDAASEDEVQIALNFAGDSLDELKAAHNQALKEVSYYDAIFINADSPR
ncbi:hypothetical protein [Pseudomonas putida]|uniref:hypothetical protein n=1 Tax=Pseudomonas putida TaxID=303 RepID=UPI0021F90AF4|nr:hypothetical protein [Pseudomonas putida]MDD1987612.1 hypothetical protein [Pseudomonas putida]HDS1792684.1 hypothetical protein [Pseudomonas putida]